MHNEHVITLDGCKATPLASYLKALGVLRLVSEQVDSSVRGWWQAEKFHLQSEMDKDDLVSFFLQKYCPTPIMAPWNGGSGFFPKGPKDNKRAVVESLWHSQTPRFGVYRRSIEVAEAVKHAMKLDIQPQKEDKETFVALCRAELPDEAVDFLDSTIVMTNRELRFPPLLGTGGTDGNLDFTNNFMQRLLDVIMPSTGEPTDASGSWLQAALFGGSTAGMMKAAIGQLSPGGVGGPNARAGFSGESRVNPWDFILMMEGAVVFAAAATKRLELGRNAVMSYPFTVYPTGAGYGSVVSKDESSARAEMWLPLWNSALSYHEVSAIFREGRAQVGARGRTARNGMEFARACATLAVDRGVDSFQRFSFLQRSGKSYLAVALNRFKVSRRPEADVLNDLDRTGWLESLALLVRADESNALSVAHRNVIDAVMQLCQHGGGYRVQQLLIALGQVEKLVAQRPRVREALRPLVLFSTDWLEQAAQQWDTELELALAIAAMFSPNLPHIRSYFSPVKAHDPSTWDSSTSPRVVWQSSDLTRNLRVLIRRRLLDWEGFAKGEGARPLARTGLTEEGLTDTSNPLDGKFHVFTSSILDYLNGHVNEQRIDDLIWGLLPLAASGSLGRWSQKTRNNTPCIGDPLPWAYLVTKLVVLPRWQRKQVLGTVGDVNVPIPVSMFAQLESDTFAGVKRASEIAERRLMASGVSLRHRNVASPGLSGRRCAAALAFPVSTGCAKILAESAIRKTTDIEQKDRSEVVSRTSD